MMNGCNLWLARNCMKISNHKAMSLNTFNGINNMKSLLVQHNSNNKIIIHNNIHVGFACVQLSALDSAVSFLYTLDV